jgi:hypothetical protein
MIGRWPSPTDEPEVRGHSSQTPAASATATAGTPEQQQSAACHDDPPGGRPSRKALGPAVLANPGGAASRGLRVRFQACLRRLVRIGACRGRADSPGPSHTARRGRGLVLRWAGWPKPAYATRRGPTWASRWPPERVPLCRTDARAGHVDLKRAGGSNDRRTSNLWENQYSAQQRN